MARSSSITAVFELQDLVSSPARAMLGPLRDVDRQVSSLDSVMRTVNGRLRDARGRFLTVGGAASGAASSIGAAASKAASSMQLYASVAVAAGSAVFGAMSGAIESVIEAGKAAESTQIAIAGMLQAAGASGSFPAAMLDAADVIEKIRRDAAVLPGEAEQFVAIFRTALPKALEAGLSRMQAADLSNRIGAVTITMGIDAEQSGRDLNLLLAGRAGANVRTWTAMSDAIRRAGVDIKKNIRSAADFNRLTAAQRADVLGRAASRYGDMISAFGDTWDAQYSTLVSNLKDLFRLGTGGVFEYIKGVVKEINAWFSETSSRGRVLRAVADEVFAVFGSFFQGGRASKNSKGLSAVFDAAMPVLIKFASLLGQWIFPVMRAIGRGFGSGFLSSLGPLNQVMGTLGTTRPNIANWQTIGELIGKTVVILIGLGAIAFRAFSWIAEGAVEFISILASVYLAIVEFGAWMLNLYVTSGSIAKMFETVGGMIVDGMVVGFQNKWESAKAVILASFQQLPVGVGNLFDMHSPSRVFAELGGYTAEGFQLGLERGTPAVEGSLARMLAVPATSASGFQRQGAGEVNIHFEVHGNASSDTVEELRVMLREELAFLLGQSAVEQGA